MESNTKRNGFRSDFSISVSLSFWTQLTDSKCFTNCMFTFWKWNKEPHTDWKRVKENEKENGMEWWNLWFDENCAQMFCMAMLYIFIVVVFECRILHCSLHPLVHTFVLLLLLLLYHFEYRQSCISQNRWKQDKAINFTTSECWARMESSQLILASLGWAKTAEKKIVTHGYTITKFTFLRLFVLFFFRSILFFFGQKHSFFSCCGCKKSCPKSEINSIFILFYNTVILRFCFRLLSPIALQWIFNKIKMRDTWCASTLYWKQMNFFLLDYIKLLSPIKKNRIQ